MRHIKATVGFSGSIAIIAPTSTNYTGVTYVTLNKAFNEAGICKNIKLRWIAVYVFPTDTYVGGTLVLEVSNSFLQDKLDTSNNTSYADQGHDSSPPRIKICIPPNQQISRDATSTDNAAYFAYLFTGIAGTVNVNYTVRAGITVRV